MEFLLDGGDTTSTTGLVRDRTGDDDDGEGDRPGSDDASALP
jgi:hypothetical protein